MLVFDGWDYEDVDVFRECWDIQIAEKLKTDLRMSQSCEMMMMMKKNCLVIRL